MVDFSKEEMRNSIAYEKHKDKRIQEMHERFINYKSNKKKQTKTFKQRI